MRCGHCRRILSRPSERVDVSRPHVPSQLVEHGTITFTCVCRSRSGKPRTHQVTRERWAAFLRLRHASGQARADVFLGVDV